MRLVIGLLTATLGFGAVGNIAIRGVTATQAILSYSAPDAGVCAVEVSESATYTPLVHDVDPVLFTGANLDSRAESTSSGRQRVFVVGKRRAEKAVNGHWYSRALQMVTPHYYRITCGSSIAAGTFETANLALGSTYNDAFPPDPAVSSRPYVASMGSYAWPEFINWNKADPTARPETVIDPQTGMLLKRMGMPQDAAITFLPGGGEHNFNAVMSADGAWTLGTTTWSIANGKLVQIVTGASSATVTTSTTHGLVVASRVTISGLTTGNGIYTVTGGSGTTFQIALGGLTANTTLNGAGLTVTAFAGTADTGTVTTFSGTNSNYLLLRDEFGGTGASLRDTTLPTEFFTLAVKGWCSGTCAGEDAKIQACITINGVTCWPTNATAKYQEAALGSAQTSNFVTIGTATPILDAWTPAGFLPLNKPDVAKRFGIANVDAAGVVTWQQNGGQGTYFSPNWMAGSRILLGQSECTMTAAGDTKRLTIDPATCSVALTLPATNVAWQGSNFGFLIRKKTSGTDTINVQFAKYNSGTSNSMEWTASGSAVLCSPALIKNTVTGGLGYHCVNYANLPMLYWIDRKTGDANFLGFLNGGQSGTDGINGNCAGNSTLSGTTPTAPESYYCVADDNEVPSKKILASCTVNTNNQSGNLALTCVNLTIGSQGKDLVTLVAQFAAGGPQTYDAVKYSGCGVSGAQGTKVLLSCGPGPQDTLKWIVVFDPRKVGTAPGCVGGGKPGCVVAAMPTWPIAPARWCSLHTLFASGNTDTVWIAGKPFVAITPAQTGDGPYTSDITVGSLGATPTTAAGTGGCPAGSSGCNVVTVDGEPCDTTPAAGEAATSPCPKNAAWVYLQDSKVGDVFQVDNELLRLEAKNGNQWTLQRGYGISDVVAHASLTLPEHCLSREFATPTSNWSWTWDSAGDPHGLNADGTTVRVAYDYDHPVPRTATTIGGDPFYDTKCIAISGSCYGVRDGVGAMGDPPNRLVDVAPAFAGALGASAFLLRAEDHPSRLQDTAPTAESKWFMDGRPLKTFIDISDAAIQVTGSLYRVTSTTTDGDTLKKTGYNIYVVKTSATTLVAAGNCTAANPCPIWNDAQIQDSISTSCTVTLSGSGSGTVWVSRLSTGGLGITRSSGLTVASDNCPVGVGSGYPAGSTPMWIWSVTAGAFAASGTDDRGGSSGVIGTINRKLEPTWAYCGTQPLIDASSAATGDVIGGTPVDAYKYCVARKGGECRAASAQGDIYANCPAATRRNDGSFGCQFYLDGQDEAIDICLGNHSAYLNTVAQMGFSKNDFKGAFGRALTKGLGHYKVNDAFFHAKALPDASWITTRILWVNGAWSEVLLGKTPPFPPSDTVDRSTFVPVPVKLSPPPALGVNNAIVQFGYAENGSPGGFFCTSRQEKCLVGTATVGTVPFSYASEGTGGVETGVTGLNCASSCTVAVPAVSGRMLYYQVRYRDASNRTLATGQVEVVAVP